MALLTRATSLTHFAKVAHEAGLDAAALLDEVGLPATALHADDLMLPIDAVAAVLELAAERSGWIDFGLRMAEGRQISNLGPLGLLLREEATLRRALGALMRYLHTYNEALAFKVEEDGRYVILREDALVGRATAVRQGIELSLAVSCRVLGLFMGSHWQPHRVCFAHAAPRGRTLHARAFGPGVEFGHDFNGLVIHARELDVPNPGADPVIARYARQALESARGARRRGPADEIRHLVLLLLPTGSCSVEAVARHFGVTRRTIHRQLEAEGLSFTALVQLIRRELAQRYVEHGARPLEQVGALLGFAQASSFSRWYRAEFGAAARQTRGGR